MTRKAWLDVCLIALLTSAVGCATKQERRETTVDSTTSERVDEDRDRSIGSAERRLAEVGARIDSLRSELRTHGAAARAEMEQEIEDLEAKRREAAAKLNEMKAAGADRWTDAKRNMADVLDELDRRFDSLRSRLREGRG